MKFHVALPHAPCKSRPYQYLLAECKAACTVAVQEERNKSIRWKSGEVLGVCVSNSGVKPS